MPTTAAPNGANSASGPGIDWRDWHRGYDDPASALAGRLALVQGEVHRGLDTAPPGPIRAVSLCAGDGRDLLGVLTAHPRAGDVCARLMELDPGLAAAARTRAADLSGVQVLTADASDPQHLVGAVPADLVLVCGVLGNMGEDDAFALLRWLPQACAPGATVVWTRHRKEPDLCPRLRTVLTETGFAETAFHAPAASWAGVGAARWPHPTPRWDPPARLFAFTPDKVQG